MPKMRTAFEDNGQQFAASEPDSDVAGDASDTTALGVLGGMPGLNFIIPGIAEGIGQANTQRYRNQQARNAEGIELPTYEGYDDVHLGYAGDVNPEAYGTPEEAKANLAVESPEGRAAMLDALKELGTLTDQSVGSKQALRRNQAEMDARQLANSREQAIRQDAARRGRIGGAADMLSRQQAAQSASNANLNAGLQSAQAAALEELAGNQQKADIGGKIRAGDQTMALSNADILNKFGMYNTAAKNAAMQHNVDARNAAATGNRDAFQSYLGNAAQLGLTKKDRANANKAKGFGDQMTKYGAVNDVLKAKAGDYKESSGKARSAGQEEWNNQKDVYEMFMGAFGGGFGGG